MHKIGTDCNELTLKNSFLVKNIFSKIPRIFCKEFQIVRITFKIK